MPLEMTEFAPLELERAEQLRDLINEAASEKEALVIDPDQGGVTQSTPVDLISPNENTNGLARYQRHY